MIKKNCINNFFLSKWQTPLKFFLKKEENTNKTHTRNYIISDSNMKENVQFNNINTDN